MKEGSLLRWTRFASDPHGTGGDKRSAQIRALCEAAGIAVADLAPAPGFPRWRCWLAGLRARARWGRRASVDHAGIGLTGHRTRFYRQALDGHRGTKLLLWETTYDSVLPALAHDAGFSVIALPHNLEAVAAAAFAGPGGDPAADFDAEVARLARADAIFTISKEERWLLETRGLHPFYLPYFPDPVLQADCERIRRHREAAARDGRVPGPLLVLGSAFNPATARGIQFQLETLGGAGFRPGQVVAAGPRTDTMAAGSWLPGLKPLGLVPRPALEELLATCSALLLHTEGGTGALTRIPEALLAGVPVIANSNAARDQYGVPGVSVYEDTGGLLALARNPPPIPPLPAEPAAAGARLIAEIRRLSPSPS